MESIAEMIQRTKATEIEARFPTCRLCKLRRMRQSYIVDNGIKVSTCAPCRIGSPKVGCTPTRLALKQYMSTQAAHYHKAQEEERLRRRDAMALERHLNPPFATLVGKPCFLADGYVSYIVHCKHTYIRNMSVKSRYTDKKAAMASIDRSLKRITRRLQQKLDNVIVCKWSLSNFDVTSATGSRIGADEWSAQTVTAR